MSEACSRMRPSGARLGRALAVLAVLVLLAVMAVVAGGCEPYALRGKVIAGPRSTVEVVGPTDPRFDVPAIEGARVRFVLDPQSAGREALGTVEAGPDGFFELPVEAFGAGSLEYRLGIIARGPGRAPAAEEIALPAGGRYLLIMLKPGEDRLPAMEEDPRRDIERFMR